MKILVAGDYCDKNRVKQAISKEKYSLMFDDIKDIISQADLRIVNFEFPIVEAVGNPIKKCGPSLSGSTKAIDAIKYAGFNICTLANNHILDQGEECCLRTKELLETSGIKTVGIGRNLKEASEILYIKQGDETIAIINCCENEFSIAENSAIGSYPLSPIKQYYQIQEAKRIATYVLVIVHGGHEQFQLPSPRMKELYHYFVTIGADAVVNHHQHCYSGYEIIDGKPIIYGLGNFLFDWNSQKRTPWNEGYLVVLDSLTHSFEIIPYIQSLDAPKVTPMNDIESYVFRENVKKLNRIISDDVLLEKHVNTYYEKSAKYELSILEPYQSKIFVALHLRGLLPRFIRGSKLLQILNHVTCESHLDKLHYALRKMIK